MVWVLSAVVLTTAAHGCRLTTEQTPVAQGVVAPDFALPSHDGASVSLSSLLADGPAVVIFYRGHW